MSAADPRAGLDPQTIIRLRSVPVERTPQRLDPIGVQSAWTLVPLLSLVAIGYAIASTIQHADQLRDPGLAVAALFGLVVAAGVYCVRTHPGLAPFGRWSHVSVIGVTVFSACLFWASVWGANERIQDDWGQIAVALFLVAMPLYRPVSEVIVVAIGAAAVLGAVASLQAPTFVITANPVVYATVAGAPVIALALGGAGYAWTMTEETLAWRQVAREGQARLEGELREAAERMVAQERTAALGVETVPFLEGILSRGEVTAAEAERARELADRLRASAVAAVGRTWLAETVGLALAARGAEARPEQEPRVHDPGRLDRALSEEQRAVVGALVATLASLPGLDPDSVHVDVSEPLRPCFVLTARVSQRRSEVRRALVPFLSALRSVSMDASLRVTGEEVVVRFAYPGSRR